MTSTTQGTDSPPHIFLSYAREDGELIEKLAVALEAEGFSVWWDRRNLPVGHLFHRMIDQAIHVSACVLVLWSENSLESDWVWDEANEAKELQKLIPVRTIIGDRPRFFSRHS